MRFLILDEADRLMSNAYQGWVASIQHALSTTSTASTSTSTSASGSGSTTSEFLAPSTTQLLFHSHRKPLQRLLFSATLADNPRKLALLGIRNPLLLRASIGQQQQRPFTDKSIDSVVKVSNGDELPDEDHDTMKSDATAVVTATAVGTGVGGSGFVLPAKLLEALCYSDTESRALDIMCLLFDACKGSNNHNHTQSTTTAAATAATTNGNIQNDVKSGENDTKDSLINNICSAPGDMILIFASSIESTHRLCRLIQLVNMFGSFANNGTTSASISSKKRKLASSILSGSIENNNNNDMYFGGAVAEISSTLRAADRESIMHRAQAGDIKILVCSDQLSRGIDLPNIKLVINYDMPTYAKVYVHRAGRTARADKEGICVTMLKAGQIGQFRKMRVTISSLRTSSGPSGSSSSSGGGGKVTRKCKASERVKSAVEPIYNEAIAGLGKIMKMESDGSLSVSADIPANVLH